MIIFDGYYFEYRQEIYLEMIKRENGQLIRWGFNQS